MFWDNTQRINSNSIGRGASLNMGAAAGALGIGGAIGTLANGLTIGSGKTSTTTTVQQAERILTLPPLSIETITLPVYSESIDMLGYKKSWNFKWCGSSIYMLPINHHAAESINYSYNGSPLRMSIFITHSTDDNFIKSDKKIIDFYVNKLVGTKEWIGSKESTSEIRGYGYDTSIPHILVKYENN